MSNSSLVPTSFCQVFAKVNTDISFLICPLQVWENLLSAMASSRFFCSIFVIIGNVFAIDRLRWILFVKDISSSVWRIILSFGLSSISPEFSAGLFCMLIFSIIPGSVLILILSIREIVLFEKFLIDISKYCSSWRDSRRWLVGQSYFGDASEDRQAIHRLSRKL